VAAGEPLREIALSYTVDHSTIARLKAWHGCRDDLIANLERERVWPFGGLGLRSWA
jgi:hypothetical protein